MIGGNRWRHLQQMMLCQSCLNNCQRGQTVMNTTWETLADMCWNGSIIYAVVMTSRNTGFRHTNSLWVFNCLRTWWVLQIKDKPGCNQNMFGPMVSGMDSWSKRSGWWLTWSTLGSILATKSTARSAALLAQRKSRFGLRIFRGTIGRVDDCLDAFSKSAYVKMKRDFRDFPPAFTVEVQQPHAAP